ncbi:MAG: DUF4386 domain-containing protein [Maribacter sp.]|nr:DUF4386 domain-containing protein [Maribacter sp.]
MNIYRKTAILVGILFITATVASSLSILLTEHILETPDYLTEISSNASQIALAALLMLIDAVAVVGIAIVIHPILKKYNDTLALGYVGARTIESVFFTFYSIILLSLMTLGQGFAEAAASDVAYFQSIGNTLMTLFHWNFTIGYGVIFTLSALLLNYVLFKSKLVPRWISVFGIIGATISLVMNLLIFYGIELPETLDIVIALQEMVLAVWLITKGFNASTIDSLSTKETHTRFSTKK